MIALLLRGGMVAATLGPYVKPVGKALERMGVQGVHLAGKLIRKKMTRPGIGSKVTKGPLKVGKATIYGSSMPGTGTTLAAASAAGAAAVALRRGVGRVAPGRAAAPRTQTQPQPQRRATPARASQGTRKCCPAGTRRMVCFKRGRTKKQKPGSTSSRRSTARKASSTRATRASSRRSSAPSAKQLAARKRFAAAARKGAIRKGAKL